MLSFGGHQVRGFGLAAASFAQASLDLQNQVVLPTTAGASYYAQNEASFLLDYTDAVTAWQAAGQAGATSVAPEIDASGAPATTQPLTAQAAALYVQLSNLPKSGLPDPASNMPLPYWNQADADAAASYIYQMVSFYTEAITSGAAALGQPSPAPTPPAPNPAPAPTPTPTPSSAPASNSSSAPAVVAVLVLGAGAVAFYAASKRSPQHAHA